MILTRSISLKDIGETQPITASESIILIDCETASKEVPLITGSEAVSAVDH